MFDDPLLVALDLDALTAIGRKVYLVGHAMTSRLVDAQFVCIQRNLDDACPHVCE